MKKLFLLIGVLVIFLVAGCNDGSPKAVMLDGKYVYPAEKAGDLFRVTFEGHIYIIRSDRYRRYLS